MIASSLAVLWLATASEAAAQAPAPPAPAAQAKPAAVGRSTATLSPTDIYTSEKLRDPFALLGAGSVSSGKEFDVKEHFNIHNLSLRGVMRDPGGELGLFRDGGYGVTFVFRKGKLYDMKGKVVAGVSGSVNLKQKSAHLMTQEGDVQTFRLGEETDE